jgi:hypothetical protein
MRYLLACALLSAAATAQVTYYSAYLEPGQEVPPTASTGHGWGIVRFDASSSSVTLFAWHTGLTSASIAAHMHQAPAGVNGGVIVGMSPITADTWAGSGVLTPAQVTALQSDGMYLNVHTTVFGGGEIRGQVVKAKSTRFTTALTGTQEVPPTGSAATGTAVAFLHEPDNRIVYLVNSSGLVGVTAAHFHQGAVGVNGPVVIPLNGSGGTYGGVSARLTAAQVSAWNADGFYCNIHTTAFGGGEIRGQMRKEVGDHFYAVCDGAQETPPVPTAGIGGASLVIGPTGVITVSGQFTGLTSAAIAAHVHVGAVGVPGPVLFPLSFSGGVLSGTYTPTPADLVNLRTGQWYVNVHSSTFGGGEIRGQLLAASLATTYGEGCPSTSGFIPHAGVSGVVAMGAPFTFDLYGVPAGTFSLLIIADNRDPGPVELPFVGLPSPGCFALITSNLLQFTQISNSLGVCQQPVTVPLSPFLRGIPLEAQWGTLDASIVVSNAIAFAVQ